MLPFYREITYRAWTLGAHEDVQGRADDLPGVDILLARTPYAKTMGVKLELSGTPADTVERIDGRAFGSILGIHRLSYELLCCPFVLRRRMDVQFE